MHLPPQSKGKRRQIPISSSTARTNPWDQVNIEPNPLLPIREVWGDLLDVLNRHQVVIVVGETGSGKTTQIPKALAAIGLGSKRKIVCTQPRRVAAIAVATRLQEELGPNGKELVGYRIRFRSRVARDARIHFVTDGLLLAELKSDPLLRRYDAVIVDEAHERTLNIDFLLGLLRRITARRRDLKLIITSATLDVETFTNAFKGAGVFHIKGRQFPVEVKYWPPEELGPGYGRDDDLPKKVLKALERLKREGHYGDVLIFLPTERSILEAVHALESRFKDEYVILPLFSRLAQRLQKRVFRPYPRPKIIVATNVAETSLTIPGIRVVIDTGLARISRFNVRTRTKALPIERISRASADQRAGRAGRTGPGVAIRLYSQDEYQGWDEHTLPEIKRSNLDSVLLNMLAMGIEDPLVFPFIDAPNQKAIQEGLNTLRELGAIDARGKLTAMGLTMARLPLEPRISRMIIEGQRLGVLREVVIIASALSLQDMWESSHRKDATGHALNGDRLVDKDSDFITLIRLWQAYGELGKKGGSRRQRQVFCQGHGLSYQRMEEWREIYAEIKSILVDSGMAFKDHRRTPTYEAIHKAVIVGFLSNVAQRRLDGSYQGTRGREIFIFPTSPLAKKRPEWIVCSEMVRTTKLFARTCAAIDPRWIEDVAGEFLTSQVGEPHWEKKRGAVVALERRYLWGLLVNPGRAILYHKIDPQLSREIFIRHGLSQGELKGRFPFNDHNKKVLAELKGLEERLRTTHVLEAPEKIEAFFNRRLSQLEGSYFEGRALTNERDLQKVLRRAGTDKMLWLSKEELLKKGLREDEELRRYPGEVTVRGYRIKLVYRYSPGSEDDGVAALIPLRILPYLSQGPFEWLVPGLLPEKVKLLLRGLPKGVRRNLHPLDRTAEILLQDAPKERETPLRIWLATRLKKLFGVHVNVFDFTKEEDLPQSLRFYFRVRDERGRTMLKGRDLEALKAHYEGRLAKATGLQGGPAAQLTAKFRAPVSSIEDLKNIMAQVAPKGGPVDAPRLWIGLELRDGEVIKTAFLHRQEAEKSSLNALRELFFRLLKRELNEIKKRLIDLSALSNEAILALGGREELASNILKLILKSHLWKNGEELTGENISRRLEYLKRNIYKVSSNEIPRILSAMRLWDHVRMEICSLFAKGPTRAYREGHYNTFMERLATIFPGDFPDNIDTSQLTDIERELKALAIRARRFYADPTKDARKEARLEPYRRFLKEIQQLGDIDAVPQLQGLVAEFHHNFKELEIQTFAPEIKAKLKVSPKRLDQLKEEITMLMPKRAS